MHLEEGVSSGRGSRKVCLSKFASSSSYSLPLIFVVLLHSEASNRAITSLVNSPGLLPSRFKNRRIKTNVEHVSFAMTEMFIDPYIMHLAYNLLDE